MTHPKAGGLVTHLAMLLNVLLVSTSFPVGAAITHALEPAVLNCVRFALAAAVFAALLTLRGEWRRPRARDGLRYLLLAGALALRFGRGDLIFLAGCVSLAAFAPLTRRLDVGENLVSQTFWTLVVGTAMLALIAGSDLAHTQWQAVPAAAWSGIAWLAVFTTAATFYLLKYARLRAPAGGAQDWRRAINDGPDRCRDRDPGDVVAATVAVGEDENGDRLSATAAF